MEHVAHRLGERALGKQLGMMGEQPLPEVCQSRLALLDTASSLLFGAECLPVLLQVIERPDMGKSGCRHSALLSTQSQSVARASSIPARRKMAA